MKHIYDVTKKLLDCVKELEEAFPDRKFNLNGHLLGSIGEIIAKYYYGIDLYNQSRELHDAWPWQYRYQHRS